MNIERIRYKIRKHLKDTERKIRKRISKMKVDKTFFFCTAMILTLLVIIVFISPAKSLVQEVEIKYVGNYSFHIVTEGFEKDVPFQYTYFVPSRTNKNILKGNKLYLYRGVNNDQKPFFKNT